MYLNHVRTAADAEKAAVKADNQATRYVSALEQDVKKAEDAQKKANAAVKQETESVGKTLQDAEGKSR